MSSDDAKKVAFDVADVEGGVLASDSDPPKNGTKPLSVRSKPYDFFNTGSLDDTQVALRQRDQSGRGHLTNAELYALMQDHMTAQSKVTKYRNVILVLIAFTIVLALSNLGTSLGAATLAKDTTTEGNDLVDKRSHMVVAVQSASEQYGAVASSNVISEGGAQDDSQRARRESTCTQTKGSLDTMCTASTFSLSPSDARSVIESCRAMRTVALTRTFSRNRSVQLPICPVATGYRASYFGIDGGEDPVAATLEGPDGNIEIKPDTSGNGDYVVEGNGITGDEGDDCDGDGDCDKGLVCHPSKKTCSGGGGGNGKGLTSLNRADLMKFADVIVGEAQTCTDCEVEQVIQQAIEEYEPESDDAMALALMEALNDNSTDIFDAAKIALIERNGERTACEVGPTPGASGLCKSDAKNTVTEAIKSKILKIIEEADSAGVEPDMDAILGDLETELELDDLFVDWLLKENPAAAEEIKGRRDSAKSKAANAALRRNAKEVNITLNEIMDTGKSLNEAVGESGFTDDAIEEAFKYFDESDPGTKEELDQKGGREMRKRAKERMDDAYVKRGWAKLGSGEWAPPGGGGDKWENGQRPSAEGEEEEEGGRGAFYTDEEGYLHFAPGANSLSKQFDKMKEDAEKEKGDSGNFRRLADGYIRDSRGLQTRLNERADAMHRHLSGLVDLCEDEPAPLGCFEDNILKKDLLHQHGSVTSAEACVDACHGKGFTYAGIQGGSMCHCGDSYGSHGESTDCSMTCQDGGVCGGPSANTVYEYVAYENIDCVASSFEELGNGLLNVTAAVSTRIAPLTSLLDTVADSVKVLNNANTIGKNIQVALFAAGKIPSVGPDFATAETIVKSILKILGVIVDKANLYQRSVGRLWQQSFGRLSDVVDNMETGFVEPISSLGVGISGIGSDQCSVSVISELAGFDAVKVTDRAFGSIVNYVESLLSALTKLSAVFASSAWNVIQNGLQTVVDSVQPLIDFLDPLKPLTDLLDREITLPWFKLPYTEKYLGEAYCNSGYYLGSWPNKCWEQESNDWEVSSETSPWYMRRTCSSGGYEDRTVGGCYNTYYTAHTRGVSCSCNGNGCGCVCPSGYGIYWFSTSECTEHCSSDTQMNNGRCYKKSCNSGFNADQIQCNPHERRQYSYTALCDKYDFDSDTNRYLAEGLWEGECWQGCSSGDSLFAGLCFPPAELKISIKGIFDAFQDIKDFIMDLPIVSVIYDAIDSFVGAILMPEINYVKSMTGFSLPEFPGIALDDLPLDFFENFSFDLPSLPDLSPLFNLPETIMGSLPGVPTALVNCGTDVDCLAGAMGVSDIVDNTVGAVGEITDILDLTTLKTDMFGLLGGLKCTEWQDVTLPVEAFLETIPLIDELNNACDYTLPVCTSFDVSGAQKIIDSRLKPLFSNSGGTERDTAKALFTKLAGQIALFNLEIPLSMAVSFARGSSGDLSRPQVQGSAGIKLLQVVDKKKGIGMVTTEYPGVNALKITPSLTFTISPKVDFCKGKFSIAMSPTFGLSLVSNKGNERLFRDALETAKYYHGLNSEYEKSIDIDSDCVNYHDWVNSVASAPVWKYEDQEEGHLSAELCTLKYGALSVANLGWIIPTNKLPLDIRVAFDRPRTKKRIFGISKVVRKVTKNNPDSHCAVQVMTNSLQAKLPEFWESTDGWKHAWPCIQYWFDQKTLLDDFKARVDERSIAIMARVGGQATSAAWERVATVTFPSTWLKAPITAAYKHITGTPLIPKDVTAGSFLNGTLSTSVAVKATHPYYTGTSIGLNLGFHQLFNGTKSFDVGTFELNHLYNVIRSTATGETPDSLKNGILKSWEWSASINLAQTWSVELFTFEGYC